MPELPEVEVLVRHLAPLLKNKTIRTVNVRRAKVLLPTSTRQLRQALTEAKFTGVFRRGKFLLFTLWQPKRRKSLLLLGHLGMTGRIYLQPVARSLPKHAAVVLNLGRHDFIYEDQRYFGRLTLTTDNLARLGPEPLAADFTVECFSQALKRSAQAIKVKLLDQSLVAGVGNIYASEALFRAGISPRQSARRLKPEQVRRLWRAVRRVLVEAIACGSTIPLNHGAAIGRDRVFYFGRAVDAVDYYAERLRVYDRDGEPCVRCGAAIKRITQAARSTFYCPHCQRQ